MDKASDPALSEVTLDRGPRAIVQGGRIAIVTGASRGIGAATVTRLRSAGAFVFGLSINRPAAVANVWHQCDVSSETSVREVVEDIVRAAGRVDVLVNCAGIAEYGGVETTSLDMWNRVFAVNTTGAFLMMRAVAPIMVRQRSGRIVNIASTSSKQGEPQMAAYSASKHAILGLTRSAAAQFAKTGITVNAVCPGPVDTDMLEAGLRSWASASQRSIETGRRVFQSFNPQHRFVDAAEVASLVCYLASAEAAGINGQALNVCGGAVGH